MATAVAICNLALNYSGQKGNITSITPPDGSHYADTMARFYPIVRAQLLAKSDWSFAIKRSSVLADTTSDINYWSYRYAKPSDVLRPIAVLSAYAQSDDDVNDFAIEGGFIYTNVESAILRYVYDETDATKYPPPFAEALARKLTAATAGDIQRGIDPRIVQKFEDLAVFTLALAEDHDALNRRFVSTAPAHRAPWMAARGAASSSEVPR